MEALTGWWDDFFWGSVTVVQLFFTSVVLMTIFGLIGSAAKLSSSRIAQKIAGAYTIIFRGTPEILVLLIMYYGAAITLTAIFQAIDPSVKYVDLPPFWAGSLALGLIVGSYATETFRGAFMGVPVGRVEAARALGLSGVQTFFYIKLPEMWRLALPAYGNHLLSLIKDTALVSIIGLTEILYIAEQTIGTTGKPFTMFVFVGIIYLAFSTIITLTVMLLEKRANRHLEISK
jgi:arginine/ornithine transport system permease protein